MFHGLQYFPKKYQHVTREHELSENVHLQSDECKHLWVVKMDFSWSVISCMENISLQWQHQECNTHDRTHVIKREEVVVKVQ